MTQDFDDWYHEECMADAAEVVGWNSPEFDSVVGCLEDDEIRRDHAMHRYHLQTGRVAGRED